MLKLVLIFLAALSILFSPLTTASKAACAPDKSGMMECCKAKAQHASHQKQKSSQTKDPCVDCSLCKVPPAPTVANLGVKVQSGSADGTICRIPSDILTSGGLQLPATPPPRA